MLDDTTTSPASSKEPETGSSVTPTPAPETGASTATGEGEKPKRARKPREPKPPTIPWTHERGFNEFGRTPTAMPSKRMQIYEPQLFADGVKTDMSNAENATTEPTGTALEAKPNAALALGAGVAGFEDFQARDLVIPDLKVGQGTSRVKENVAGKLFNSIDPSEQHDRMRLVIVAFRHGQVMFARKPDGKADLEAPTPCRSNDGRVPAPSIDVPISTQCRDAFGEALCHAAKWGGDGKKPACSETYNFVVVDVNTAMPYRFSLKGESVTTAKRLLSALRNRAKTNKRSIYDFEMDVTLTKEETSDGVYYVPIFGNVAMVEAGKYLSLFQSYSRAQSAEDVEPPKPEGDAGGTVAEAAARAEQEKKDKKKSKGGKELDFS